MSDRDPIPPIAIDTMTLIWGVQKQGSDELQKRAHYLFESLEAEKAQVVVPSIVLSEFLVPIAAGKRSLVCAALAERFIIAPFDVRCAEIAAELFATGKNARMLGSPATRKCLKADAMIIACAKVAGASVLYTEDARCRKLAEKCMPTRALPDVGASLWSDHGAKGDSL